jgi:nucleoside-diphosphate-sugar epimerase
VNTLIIGHRGFVGSNLSRQLPGARGAGRKEIGALAGQTFGNIYCAAPQAKKWWANLNPEQDWQEVHSLIESCRKIACTGSFILFSTVDVYDPPAGVDERTKPFAESHPYGRHRFTLEEAVLDIFGSKARVIRLPALVGYGLKKNIIYDLLNNNNISQINPNSAFQWFNLDHLPSIIARVKSLDNGQTLNVASEPLATHSILDAWFADMKKKLNWNAAPIDYDVRTVYGSEGRPYLYSAEDTLNLHLKPYIEAHNSQS